MSAEPVGHRIRFWTALAAALLIGWTLLRLSGIPDNPGFEASLLAQPRLVVAAIVVVLVAACGAVVGGLLLGRAHYEMTILGAAAALGTLSLRGGGVRYVLFSHGKTGFWFMAGDCIVFALVLVGVWLVAERAKRAGLLRENYEPEAPPEPLDQQLLAAATHVATMGVLLTFLLTTQDKPQVLGAIGVSALLASMVAHQFVPTRPAIWFWISPLIVATIGYVVAGMSHGRLDIGQPGGPLAALARGLPVDYASAGVIGAIVGYWGRRRSVALAQSAPAAAV